LGAKDGLLIFSVGGGNLERMSAPTWSGAIQLAKQAGAGGDWHRGPGRRLHGEGGDGCVIVPTVNPAHVTPHSEAFQAVIWHLFVSHPKLKQTATKWKARSRPARNALLNFRAPSAILSVL